MTGSRAPASAAPASVPASVTVATGVAFVFPHAATTRRQKRAPRSLISKSRFA
jgi:hypothetical protein